MHILSRTRTSPPLPTPPRAPGPGTRAVIISTTACEHPRLIHVPSLTLLFANGHLLLTTPYLPPRSRLLSLMTIMTSSPYALVLEYPGHHY